MAFAKEFYPDELYSLYASQMILEKGVPVYPSGILRAVGGVMLYLQAPFLTIFGYEEGWVRLLRVFISTGGLIFTWFFAKKLFDSRVALLTVLLLAVDIDIILWGGIYTKPYSVIPAFVMLLLWQIRQMATNPKMKQFISVSLLLVILIWINPVCILLLPAFGLAYLIWLKKFSLKPFITGSIIIIIGLASIYVSIKKGDPGLSASGGNGSLFQLNFNISQIITSSKLIFKSFYPEAFNKHYYRSILFVPYLVVIIGSFGYVISTDIKKMRQNQEARDTIALIVFLSVSILPFEIFFNGYHDSYLTYAIHIFYLLGSYGLFKLLFNRWKFFNDDSPYSIHDIIVFKNIKIKLPDIILSILVIFIISIGTKHYSENLKNTGWLKPYHYVKDNWQTGDAILSSNAATYIFAVGEAPTYYYYTENPGIGIYEKDSVYVDRFMDGVWIGDSLALENVLNKHKRIWFIKHADENYINLHYKNTISIIYKEMNEVFSDENNNKVYFKK